MRILAVLCLAASCLGIASAQEKTEAEWDAFRARLGSWAESHYPAFASAQSHPSDLILGFLVAPDGRIVKHSAAIQTALPTTVADQLQRMFPDRKRSELKKNGGACFFKEGTNQKTYCVYYADVDK